MSSLKRLIAAAGAGIVLVSSLAASVSAGEAYDPYSYDRWGDAVASQVGYSAEYFVDGQSITGLTDYVRNMEGFNESKQAWKDMLGLKEPADLFISHGDDLLYIADKGNDRIIVTDLDFNMVKYIDSFDYNGETLELKKPEGVFVDQYTGFVYVCDTENSRVIKADADGKVDYIFEKPTSEIYSQDLTFNPKKVAVDKAGNVYIVVKSVTKGAVMYDINGEFLGFYGANRVEATAEIVMNAFWNTIATEQQRALSTKTTPIGFTNFDIDDDGFIYTVTESNDVKTDTVKKLNPRGTNILSSITADEVTFGDISPAYYSIYTKESTLTDIDIGPNGEMNILDFAHGRIFQYDKLANLMFVLGGTGEQLGTFRSVSAIESKDNMLYVLDSRKNSITVFKRTAFGEIVTDATNLYNAGYYEESYEPWLNVIKYDGNYRRAYIGIGNALLNAEEYEEAMKYFRISISRNRYNKAYEGYRGEILEKYFTPAVVLIIVIAVVWIVLKKLCSSGVITMPWQRRGGA
ncbi:MAG: hypothetical protein NC120_07340 [Ruminococcus sp.]|nr:hypothetical protein [Ruminococcus sp.]